MSEPSTAVGNGQERAGSEAQMSVRMPPPSEAPQSEPRAASGTTQDDPQLPTRIVGALMAAHKKLLAQLRDQNGTVVASFAKNLDQAIAAIDVATSVLRDESVQTRAALGHLESATRELRQETLRCERLIEEAPKRLESSEKALREALALLHATLRPMVWLSVSALLSLTLAGAYIVWRQARAPSPASSTAAEANDKPSGPSATSPRRR